MFILLLILFFHVTAFDIVITLLDSNNSELIFAICGVLINLMVDKENRRWLKEYNGIQK